jgi:hypothetical protein
LVIADSEQSERPYPSRAADTDAGKRQVDPIANAPVPTFGDGGDRDIGTGLWGTLAEVPVRHAAEV